MNSSTILMVVLIQLGNTLIIYLDLDIAVVKHTLLMELLNNKIPTHTTILNSEQVAEIFMVIIFYMELKVKNE